MFSESQGDWATGVVPAPPADALPGNVNLQLTGISCPAPGDCAAIGSYEDSSRVDDTPLVIDQRSGQWQAATRATVPADANPHGGGTYLQAVSCAAAGECVATGQYITAADPRA